MDPSKEEPCMHQHHDFKQEIEDSIRRCEELLSMAPVLYQPADGKSSRSTASARSEGRSVVDTVTSSMESERKSIEVDPEWKKNMGLLMNRQDGTATGQVSPRGACIPAADEIVCTETHDPGEQTVEYNFSFDDHESRNSSCREDIVEQSISISTRTVAHNDSDDPTSESGDWANDRMGQASTASTHSELNSKAESERERRAMPAVLIAFDDEERYPQVRQIEEQVEQRPLLVTEVEGGGENNNTTTTRTLQDPFQTLRTTTTRSIDGDYELVTTERTATFPRSVASSRSSHPGGPSPGRSPPRGGRPGTPMGSEVIRPSSSKKATSKRINENMMSFSFTIPSQPKYAENWEWFEECGGVDRKPRGEQQVSFNSKGAIGPLVLEGGRMRIGEAKIAKSDAKRFKVQKKYRSQRDADNSKKAKATIRLRVHGHGTQVSGDKQIVHIPARLKHLSKPRTDLYQKFAHTRAQLEEEHMSECSFRPKVGRRPNPRSRYSAPLIQRVGGIEQRVDLRKRARKVIEKEELDQCSFWPQINSNSEYLDPSHYKPIEERAMEYQRRRAAKLAKARAKEDMEMGLTFRPEINPMSLKIFKQTGLEVVNLEDRLTNAGYLHQDRKLKEVKGLPKSECTFTPEINRNTDLIMRASKLFEGCTPDFLSRQKYCMQVREMKQREKEQKFWLESTATFKPKTGNSDAILKDSPIANVFDQSIYDRVDRLYHRDPERRQHIRQKISDAYYAQFRHQPEIDETSRLLGRSATAFDLYKNERGVKARELMKSSVEEIFAKEHPFQPKLVSRSPTRPSAERMENVLHRRRQFRLEKARVLEEMKVIRELQEFKECTFKPTVNRLPPKDKEPVVVKGLGRHLELQDQAKQMKRDQEEWERKVFFQHVYALPRRQYTIPKPFSLHAGERRRETKLLQEQAAEDQPGCVVHFRFQDRSADGEHPKKGPKSNSFYEGSHPTPHNPKWKDNTIWPDAAEHPRFRHDHELNEFAFGS